MSALCNPSSLTSGHGFHGIPGIPTSKSSNFKIWPDDLMTCFHDLSQTFSRFLKASRWAPCKICMTMSSCPHCGSPSSAERLRKTMAFYGILWYTHSWHAHMMQKETSISYLWSGCEVQLGDGVKGFRMITWAQSLAGGVSLWINPYKSNQKVISAEVWTHIAWYHMTHIIES